MATPKQVDYLMALLYKAGFSNKYMNSSFKELGATMRERSGPVRSWLERMEKPQASELIDTLKERIARG